MRDPYQLYIHDHLMKPLIEMIPDFIKPNHFTVARMILTPIVLLFLFFESYDIGVPLFIVTAFTDAIDGSLARWRKQVTEWGTFYDPVADKLLIGSVILLIIVQHVNPLLAYIIILIESLMIIGGWYKRRKGVKVQANIWGKIKMILQFFGVMFLLFALWFGVDMFIPISYGTLILGILFALVALLTYSL